MNEIRHTFGFREVEPPERRLLIRRLFDAIAAHYDLGSDLTSFGVHRLWKRALLRMMERDGAQAGVFVDLAGGTGDVARLLARAPGRRVLVADASLRMVETGRKRPFAGEGRLCWIAAEGEEMPFADNSLDGVTVAFGLRNMTDPEKVLREVHRTLKPGGRFYCLEFSTPRRWLRPFYDFYSFHVLPLIGGAVSGRPAAYRYLVESIRRFPGQAELGAMMRAAGFSDVRWRDVSFGIAAIHSARKAGRGEA